MATSIGDDGGVEIAITKFILFSYYSLGWTLLTETQPHW